MTCPSSPPRSAWVAEGLAFYKFEGDLSGKYFPFTEMEEAVRRQLVDDHFLFVSGDKNLQVAVMKRDWPEGRSIFKTVSDSVKAESSKKFMLDPRYGYLQSCPTNLGTGMRASVHVDLPGWTKEGLPTIKARCEELGLQPRGTSGESGGQTKITYDMVQEMIRKYWGDTEIKMKIFLDYIRNKRVEVQGMLRESPGCVGSGSGGGPGKL